MANIEILHNLSMFGALTFADDATSFPANPQIGTMVLKGSKLFAYITVGGLDTWYPFYNSSSAYVHTQGEAATTWVIQHNLNSTAVWIQLRDSLGSIISAKTVIVDENTVHVQFTAASVGTAVIVGPDGLDVPEVKAAIIKVGPNVEINTTGVMINGQYVLTSANIDAQINAAVALEATARSNGDTSIINSLNTEISQRQTDSNYLNGLITTETTNRIAADALKSDKTYVDNTFVKQADVGVTIPTLVNGTVPANQLPSYVDDVIEVNSFPSLPETGDSGKIYVTINNNKIYRWSGSAYIEITPSPGSTDGIAEGTTNLYFTDARAQAAVTTITGNAGTATKLQTARTINGIPFDGSANITLTQADIGVTSNPYDIYGSTYGVSANSDVVIRFITARAFTIPANFAGAVAKAGTAATASSVFSIQKNGVQVGTLTFAASGTVGTFSNQAAITYAIGDKFACVAPATADSTLADIDIAIISTLS